MKADRHTTGTSRTLIRQAAADDPAAWQRMVDLYSPLVYFWCQESGLGAADLQDVFQEVFHSLYRNLGQYRELKAGSFRGWLRTITRNKINDQFRKSKKQPQAAGGTEALRYMEQIPGESCVDVHSSGPSLLPAERAINHALLRQALDNIHDQFSPQTWQAFWKVAIDGRETVDVAEELGMRPGTVRVAKSRVIKRLRMELGESMD